MIFVLYVIFGFFLAIEQQVRTHISDSLWIESKHYYNSSIIKLYSFSLEKAVGSHWSMAINKSVRKYTHTPTHQWTLLVFFSKIFFLAQEDIKMERKTILYYTSCAFGFSFGYCGCCCWVWYNGQFFFLHIIHSPISSFFQHFFSSPQSIYCCVVCACVCWLDLGSRLESFVVGCMNRTKFRVKMVRFGIFVIESGCLEHIPKLESDFVSINSVPGQGKEIKKCIRDCCFSTRKYSE